MLRGSSCAGELDILLYLRYTLAKSQDSAFSLPNSRNEQDGTKRQGTLLLAGPDYYQQPSGSFYRPQSFVTPEYQAYQAGYERPEGPVWGLAKPLPHVIRPCMKASEGERSQIFQPHPEPLRNVVSSATAAPQITDPATAPSRKPRTSNTTRVASSPSHSQITRPVTEQGSLSRPCGGAQDVQQTARTTSAISRSRVMRTKIWSLRKVRTNKSKLDDSGSKHLLMSFLLKSFCRNNLPHKHRQAQPLVPMNSNSSTLGVNTVANYLRNSLAPSYL